MIYRPPQPPTLPQSSWIKYAKGHSCEYIEFSDKKRCLGNHTFKGTLHLKKIGSFYNSPRIKQLSFAISESIQPISESGGSTFNRLTLGEL